MPPESTVTDFLDDSVPELQGEPIRPTAELPPFDDENVIGCLFVSMRFWQIPDKIPPPTAHAFEAMRFALPPHFTARQRSKLHIDSYRTVVEAVTLLMPADDPQVAFRDAFDRCLQSVENLLLAYRLATGARIAPLTRQRLPSLVPYVTGALFDPEAWDESVSIFHVNWSLPPVWPPDLISPEELHRFETNIQVRKIRHPFVTYFDLANQARRVLDREGDTGSVVIQCQTALEILVNGLLGALLWEEGISAEDAAESVFSQRSTFSRITSDLASRLRGNWSVSGDGAIAQWRHGLARVRNRVTHGGYRPHYDEAEQAVVIMDRVHDHAVSRLVERRNTYPRTTLLLVSSTELERRAAWTKKFRQYAEREMDRSLITGYRDWQQRMAQAWEALATS